MNIDTISLNNNGICDLCNKKKQTLQFDLMFIVRLEEIERSLEICRDCFDNKFKNPDYTINQL